MKMATGDLIDFVVSASRRGIVMQVEPDGTIIVRDLKAEKRRARNARHRAKKKASQIVSLPTGEASQSVSWKQQPIWRGIEWRDCPGHDEAAKKMRFALLKRGDWGGYKSCQYLEGKALKDAFAKINESQKAKSQIAAKKRTADAKARHQA